MIRRRGLALYAVFIFDVDARCVGGDIIYDKYDVTKVRFKLTVEPAGKKTFTYTVTTFHGKRQEEREQ
jgi:hypothetical protein